MRDAALESVAVGFFDGVHVGHQAILRRAGRALTFGNHPLSVLAPERTPRLIMSPSEKVAAIRLCGVGDVELVDFTPELAALSAEEFAARHFVASDGTRRRVVCGENWRFGAGGRGDAGFLRSMGFEVEVVPLDVNDDVCWPVAERIAGELVEAGIEVVVDDRKERPGVKFNDADLMGFPYQVVCGKKAIKNGNVELKDRATGERSEVSIDEVSRLVAEKVKAQRS